MNLLGNKHLEFFEFVICSIVTPYVSKCMRFHLYGYGKTVLTMVGPFPSLQFSAPLYYICCFNWLYFMDQAGSGNEFSEPGHKRCMGIVHDVTSPSLKTKPESS